MALLFVLWETHYLRLVLIVGASQILTGDESPLLLPVIHVLITFDEALGLAKGERIAQMHGFYLSRWVCCIGNWTGCLALCWLLLNKAFELVSGVPLKLIKHELFHFLV